MLDVWTNCLAERVQNWFFFFFCPKFAYFPLCANHPIGKVCQRSDGGNPDTGFWQKKKTRELLLHNFWMGFFHSMQSIKPLYCCNKHPPQLCLPDHVQAEVDRRPTEARLWPMIAAYLNSRNFATRSMSKCFSLRVQVVSVKSRHQRLAEPPCRARYHVCQSCFCSLSHTCRNCSNFPFVERKKAGLSR